MERGESFGAQTGSLMEEQSHDEEQSGKYWIEQSMLGRTLILDILNDKESLELSDWEVTSIFENLCVE